MPRFTTRTAAPPIPGKADTVEPPCTCGHPVGQHLNGGQCRASDHDGRCTCQSVDVDEGTE